MREAGLHAGLSGCDISGQMLEEGARCWPANLARPELLLQDSAAVPFGDGKFDLVIISAVLHHVPPADRSDVFSALHRSLRPEGKLVVFEHNPLNPVTRYVVAHTPIDQNAILLRARETQERLRWAQFQNVRTKYHNVLSSAPEVSNGVRSGARLAAAWWAIRYDRASALMADRLAEQLPALHGGYRSWPLPRRAEMTGGRGATMRRMLPSLAVFIALLCVAALWIGGAHRAYFALLRGIGVPAYRFPLLDTFGVLAAIDCHRRGIDVYLTNPCDPGRLHTYTPLWFRLGALPIDISWTPCIGIALALVFVASLLLLPAGRDLRAAGVIAAAALSPAVGFALERGNADLLIFVMAALAVARVASRADAAGGVPNRLARGRTEGLPGDPADPGAARTPGTLPDGLGHLPGGSACALSLRWPLGRRCFPLDGAITLILRVAISASLTLMPFG